MKERRRGKLGSYLKDAVGADIATAGTLNENVKAALALDDGVGNLNAVCAYI